MTQRHLCLLLLLTLSLVTSRETIAQVSDVIVQPVISFQALVQQAGSADVNGVHDITARLYSDVEGTKEIWSGTYTREIKSGVLNLELGSGDHPLPEPAKLQSELWLGISIGQNKELRPLTRLASAVHALSIADRTVTKEKMATDYVASVSVNGKKIAATGLDLNIVGSDDIRLDYDKASNSIIVKSNDGSAVSTGKNSTTGYSPTYIKGDLIAQQDVELGGSSSHTIKFNGKAISDLDMNAKKITGINDLTIGSSSNDGALKIVSSGGGGYIFTPEATAQNRIIVFPSTSDSVSTLMFASGDGSVAPTTDNATFGTEEDPFSHAYVQGLSFSTTDTIDPSTVRIDIADCPDNDPECNRILKITEGATSTLLGIDLVTKVLNIPSGLNIGAVASPGSITMNSITGGSSTIIPNTSDLSVSYMLPYPSSGEPAQTLSLVAANDQGVITGFGGLEFSTTDTIDPSGYSRDAEIRTSPIDCPENDPDCDEAKQIEIVQPVTSTKVMTLNMDNGNMHVLGGLNIGTANSAGSLALNSTYGGSSILLPSASDLQVRYMLPYPGGSYEPAQTLSLVAANDEGVITGFGGLEFSTTDTIDPSGFSRDAEIRTSPIDCPENDPDCDEAKQIEFVQPVTSTKVMTLNMTNGDLKVLGGLDLGSQGNAGSIAMASSAGVVATLLPPANLFATSYELPLRSDTTILAPVRLVGYQPDGGLTSTRLLMHSESSTTDTIDPVTMPIGDAELKIFAPECLENLDVNCNKFFAITDPSTALPVLALNMGTGDLSVLGNMAANNVLSVQGNGQSELRIYTAQREVYFTQDYSSFYSPLLPYSISYQLPNHSGAPGHALASSYVDGGDVVLDWQYIPRSEHVSIDHDLILPYASATIEFALESALDILGTVHVSPASELPDGLVIAYSRISAPGMVQIKLLNMSQTSVDAGSLGLLVGVIR